MEITPLTSHAPRVGLKPTLDKAVRRLNEFKRVVIRSETLEAAIKQYKYSILVFQLIKSQNGICKVYETDIECKFVNKV